VADLTEEDAFAFIVRYLREGKRGPYSEYGYEIYLPNVVRTYGRDVLHLSDRDAEQLLYTDSPPFYAAAWELCRRGILRPGIVRLGVQTTDDGNGGNGYTLTPRGREWVKAAASYDYVPTEPGRFARILAGFAPRFGPGFAERSQEAVQCYGALAYVACCAMCGAAAESILLAVAIAAVGDSTKVLSMYEATGGRGRVENLVIGKKPKPLQDEFRAALNLLKYWRDAAAHGRKSGIGENEAYTSLALLLRFAQFANERWQELTFSEAERAASASPQTSEE
jgi:hypothetical protein